MPELPGWVMTVPPVVGDLAIWAPPASDNCAPTIFVPVGFHAIDEDVATVCGTAFATTEVDEEARAMYLGRAQRVFTGGKVVVDVQLNLDPVKPPDWAEVGLLKSSAAPVLCAGPQSMTRIKAVDATADWTVPGPVATDLGALAIAAGDHIWLAWSCKMGIGNLPSFRAMLADKIASGLWVCAAGVQLTTMGANTNFNRCGSAVLGVQSVVGCSY